ncbi:MAG: NADH-quinone oxidoreductase subunit NuoG [Pseudomonadota bacterium]
MSETRTLNINGTEIEVPAEMNVLQACEEAGAEIPRFCYHERLSIAGNCRMCLVEWVGAPKPQASCALSVKDLRPNRDGSPPEIRTNSPLVKKAREGVMEFLLINHPLDCPICDQGGECDLQDQSMTYGRGASRYDENKRAVAEKYMGPLIKTIMTRCIHCTRCVRFAEEVAGVEEIGAVFRGENMQITTYLEKAASSEMSANVIDLCPVGALTSKPYAFKARPWELKNTPTIDVMDAVGSHIRMDSRSGEVMRVLPRLSEDINEEWISDKTRYACDGLAKRRLDRPYVKRDGELREASWDEAFAAIVAGLQGKSGDRIAAIAGDLADVEGMWALKSLVNSLGSTMHDCRSDGTLTDASARAGYIVNSTIAGIEAADALLLIGANPRVEAPIINTRIRTAIKFNGMKVAAVGAEVDLTYPVDWIGEDLTVLASIKPGDGGVGDMLASAERPLILLGQGALMAKDAPAIQGAVRALVERVGAVGEDWNGYGMLHTAAGRVGGLDIGFISDGGVPVIEDRARAGELDAAFLLHADERDVSPFRDVFTVYVGSHGDIGVSVADVILPAAAYSEKSAYYVNTEGRVQRTLKAVFPPGDAREDWTIFRALSERVGTKLPFDSHEALREQIVAAHPHFAELDQIVPAAWDGFGSGDAIDASHRAYAVQNFYMTNPVARASETMANCVAEILGEGEEKGTGTDG